MSLQKCHGRPQSKCKTDCRWYDPAWRSGPGYCVRDEDATTGTIQTLCANLSELDPTIVRALMEDLAAYGVFTSNQIRRFDKMGAAEQCSTLSRGLLSHMFLRQFGRNRDEISDRITELRNSWKQWVLGGRLVTEVKTIDQYKQDIDELLARTRTELGLKNDVDALPGAVSLVKQLTHPSKASIGKGWWVGGAGAALGTAAFLYYVFGTAQGGQMLDTMKAAASTQAPVTAEPSSDTKVPVQSNTTTGQVPAEKESIAPPAADSVPKNTKNAVANANRANQASGTEPLADETLSIPPSPNGKGTNKVEAPAPPAPKSESSTHPPSEGSGGNASVAVSWFGQISADPTSLLFVLIKVIGYPMLLALLAWAYAYLEFLFPVWLRRFRPSGFEREPLALEAGQELPLGGILLPPRPNDAPPRKYYARMVDEKLKNVRARTDSLLSLAEKVLPKAAFQPLKAAVYGFQQSVFGTFKSALEDAKTGGVISIHKSERDELEKAIQIIDSAIEELTVSPIIPDLNPTQAMDELPDQVSKQGWLRGTWEWAKGIVSSISGKIGQNKMVIAYLTLILFSVGAAYLYQQSSGGNGTEQGFVNSTAEQLNQEQQQQPPNALKT